MLVHLDDQNVEVYEAVDASLKAFLRNCKEEEKKDIWTQIRTAQDKNYNKFRVNTLME